VSAAPAPEVERGELAVYFTAEQVAALLQCSPKTIYRLAKLDATLPAIRVGGLLRFPRLKLEQWLAARTQGTGRRRRLAAVPDRPRRPTPSYQCCEHPIAVHESDGIDLRCGVAGCRCGRAEAVR
jgi:excisionase family DNA binding protein